MKSRIYECRVGHARLSPVRHAFVYRLFFLAIDLDELPVLHRRLRLFSVGRFNLFGLRENDYLPVTEPRHPEKQVPRAAPLALKERVRAVLAEAGLDPGPAARVELVTLPRLLGYAFNPVSFFFCFARDGTPVAAIAEVTNTFREMKPYVVPAGPAVTPSAATFQRRCRKDFYVSPFSAVDLSFDFQLRAPQERLALQIDIYRAGERTLTSRLAGRRQPLTDGVLARLALTYPFMTLGVIARIHLQALRLYLKRVPWFGKTDRSASQRGLYRPHASLSSRTP